MRRNFDLLGEATSRLGGIPPLLSPEDCWNERGPDPKAVILFLAYLCPRLLEVSKEERAAHTIQILWRRRQARKPGAGTAPLTRLAHAQIVDPYGCRNSA